MKHMHFVQLIWFCEETLEILTKVHKKEILQEKSIRKIVANIKNTRKTQRNIIGCLECKNKIGKQLLRAISFFNKTCYILYKKLININGNKVDFISLKKCLTRIVRFLDTDNALKKWPKTLEILQFADTFDASDEVNNMQLVVMELTLGDDLENLAFLSFLTTINQSWKTV